MVDPEPKVLKPRLLTLQVGSVFHYILLPSLSHNDNSYHLWIVDDMPMFELSGIIQASQ